MNRISQSIVGLCYLAILVGGCGPPPIQSAKQVAGEYAIRYGGGEIEVLVLQENLEYHQALYANLADYQQQETPLYTNSAKWGYTNSAVTMTDWLSFCRYPNPQHRIDPPQRFAWMTGDWRSASGAADAVIWLSQEELKYVLGRVNDRNDLR